MNTYLSIPTKLFSIFAFTAILFVIILTYVFHQNISVNLNFNMPSPRLLLLLVYVFCLLAVLLLPSANESVFMSLGSLGVTNWLRIVAGLLLGIFLPGYALISLFNHKLNLISLSVSSFLLTISIDSAIAFAAVALAQSALTWMLIINALIVSLSLIDTLRDKIKVYSLKHRHNVTTTLDNMKILMLLLCLFQLSLLVSVFLLSGLTVPNGDMWDHASLATRMEKGGFLRFGSLTYPPFFSVHLFFVSQLTGLPVISVSNLLGLTNIFIVLAFYALVLTLTRKRSVAFLSTFAFTMFGSFTFLVQAVLGKMVADPQRLADSFLQVSGKTMQVNSVYTLANICAYAPSTLDFISVLFLTALFLQKDKGRILYAVEAFLIANLFLLHVAETMYVLIFLLAALLLNLSRIKDLVSLTLGVWLGTAVLSTLPFVGSSVSLYVAVVYTVVLVFTLLCTRVKVLPKLRGLYGKGLGVMSKGYVRAFLAFAILSLYGLLLLVWTVLYIDRDGYIPGVLSYLGAAPTYFMPIVFGVSMTISVLFLAKCLVSKDSLAQNEKKVVIFLVAAFIIAYLFGKALTLANISGYMIYRELRVLSIFGGILFSIVSGYALHRVFQHVKGSKTNQKHILAVGLGLLILLGSGSTFLSAVFWANTGMGAYPLHSNEVEALDFLKRMVNASDVVLTYNQESQKEVGLTGASTLNRFTILFSSVSQSIPNYFLQTIDYIYLTKQDYDNIQKSDTYMKALIPVLPVIFNNTEIMIFSVPPNIKRYMCSLSVPVVISRDMKEALPKLALLDSLGISYRIYDTWDPGILAGSSTVILTDDVENASDAQKYADWVQNGGNLIILGENEGYYSNLMEIRAKTQMAFQDYVSADGLLCNEDSVPLGFKFNITAPKESLGENVQAVSWYTLDNQKVAPFMYTKDIGEGRLTYVDFTFLSKVIPNLSHFSRVLLESLDPSLLNYTKQDAEMKLFPIEIDGDQSLNGTVGINSDTMAFWGSKVTYSPELSNGTKLFTSADSLAFNSPYNLALSLNGSVTIQPYHDEYVKILIPSGTTFTVTFYNQESGTLTCISDSEQMEWYNVTKSTISSNSLVTAIVRSPNITVTGVSRFQGAFFDIPYNDVVGSGLGALTLQGKMTYNILISDGTSARTFGDQSILVGSYKYDYPTILQIELPSNFLTIEQNLLLLIIIILILAAFIVSLFKHWIFAKKRE
jgi:hypothetical protein